MKVILTAEVKGKGHEGDVVDVARGYAVNYLMPRKMAIIATTGNIKQLEARMSNINKRNTARLTDAESIAASSEGKSIMIEAKATLARHLGRPVEFRNIAFDGLITALQTGSVDIIISAMTANDERRKSLDFSDPYVTTGICLLLPKNSTLKSAEELKQGRRRVVVKIATTGFDAHKAK